MIATELNDPSQDSMPDALPVATFPIYLGLGLPSMYAGMYAGLHTLGLDLLQKAHSDLLLSASTLAVSRSVVR